MNITRTHRGIGIAGLATTAFAVAAMLTGAALAAPPSDAAKAKLANGHWGGGYGDVWIPGPYEKAYKVNPPVNEAAKSKMANGHWGGGYGDAWVPGAYEQPYKVSPQLSATTKDNLGKGHWGGGYGSVWIPASAKK